MATATNKQQSNTFECAGCLETGQLATHPHPAIKLGGIRYCKLCAEERQDELAQAVSVRLKKGELRWGHHYLSVTRHPVRDESIQPDEVLAEEIAAWVVGKTGEPPARGFFTLDVVCYCNGNHSHVDLFRSHKEFWQAFARFCNAHYDQLKPLVK